MVSSVASDHPSGPWEAEAGLGPTNTPSAARKRQTGQSTLVLHFFLSCDDCVKQKKRFREPHPSKSD